MTLDLILCLVAAFAGFVDAIAGGGGLIQLPFLMILRPDMAAATWLGTNKCSSFFGTSAALFRYSRSLQIPWKTLLPAGVAAFVASYLGARLSVYLPSESLKPIIIVLLFGIFLHSLLNRQWGKFEKHKKRNAGKWALVLGLVIGFYDGFFGPGTGGFLIFTFISILGMDYLKASASAKVVNWMTNLAALVYFGSSGHIDFRVGMMMAAFNMVGGLLGSRFAIKKGNNSIRMVFNVVVLLALGRLLWSYL